MSMQITDMQSSETGIEGLLVITLKQVSDERGTVREFFRASALGDFGTIRQINVTESGYGAIRGLHGESTTKLVGCIAGEAFGAYLDTRPDSASYGKLVTVELKVGTQVLVPPGVCNGFQSVSRGAASTSTSSPTSGTRACPEPPSRRWTRASGSAGRSRCRSVTRPRSRPRTRPPRSSASRL